jgi:predicted DNA-binding helix-hairpin-helix protein
MNINGNTNDVHRKLAILADAAKYDASCASSGASGRNSRDGKGLGSTTGSGICHAYTPDGRCVSLLKVLLTNFCVYDCAFCVNRLSSNTPRARFKVEEIVALTLGFYRRNMIEGLFLSSGIAKSEDHTMEEMVRVAETLRRDHDFRGYIHLKAMGGLRLRLDEAKEEKRKTPRAPRFAPAGQSTQMIIGADEARDRDIITRSASLYASYGLRPVYYSAFSPIPHASQSLPLQRPPLMREHRLYQADWLMRYYGFASEEILDEASDGMLDLDRDPKLAWALRNRALFPIDVNRAPRETLLRVRVWGRVLSSAS